MRWMSKISAADLLTVTNGLLGVLAITYILDGEHVIASLRIFFALIADGLDGMVARKFGTPHEFGRFLDSISDAVSFCLAPALLIYNKFYDNGLGSAWVSMPNAVAVIACMFYASFGILRLARFAGKDHSKAHFIGLPTPAAAILVISICMLWGREDLNPFAISYMPYAASLVTVIVSFIMVSDVPYPNVRGRLMAPASLVLLLASIPMIFHIILGDIDNFPATEIECITLVLISTYLVLGPFLVPRKKRKRSSKKVDG